MAIGVALILVVAGVFLGSRLGLFHTGEARGGREVIEELRALPHLRLEFVLLYTIAAAAGVPVTALVIAGGVLFGPVAGIALNFISDMLAAILGFSVGRMVKLSFAPTKAIEASASLQRGFWGLLRLRLIPVVPFAILNYGAAAYGMGWGPYLAATAIGVIPTAVVYTLFASSVAAGAEGSSRHAFLAAAGIGLVAIIMSLAPRWLGARARTDGHRTELE